jgi:hypothetical protein
MKLSIEELYRRAKRVAVTHNGKNFPRHAQIDAIAALQEFITAAERVSTRAAEPASGESFPRAPQL